MPKPKSGESKDDFLQRCMGDDVMVSEYDDEKQRYAICQDLWKKKGEQKMWGKFERRMFSFAKLELRKNENNESTMIVGYPAVFNRLSEDLGGFQEKVAPGAFRKSLRNKDDIRALLNHDHNYVLGRTTSDTLSLKEDKKGLYMKLNPPETQWAADLRVSIGRGDINQMSFGFIATADEWAERKNDIPVRTLKEAELLDVSIVAYPAYPDTSVALRSFQAWEEERKNNGGMPKDGQEEDGKPNLETVITKCDDILEKIEKLEGAQTRSGEQDNAEPNMQTQEGEAGEPEKGQGGAQTRPTGSNNTNLLQRLHTRVRQSDWQ